MSTARNVTYTKNFVKWVVGRRGFPFCWLGNPRGSWNTVRKIRMINIGSRGVSRKSTRSGSGVFLFGLKPLHSYNIVEIDTTFDGSICDTFDDTFDCSIRDTFMLYL